MTKLKLRSGSSSILVILLVVTMVVFGVLAMMSSYAGLKMANKNAVWTSEYYELESKAEILVFDIKNILQENLENANQSEDTYWLSINKALAQISNKEVTVTSSNREITVVGNFKNQNNDKFLTLIKINYPDGLLSSDAQALNDISKLMDIKKWQLVPRDVEYDNTIEFKDLEVDIDND